MQDAHPHGTAAVPWANGRIDTFWVNTDRSLIHRAFQDGAWGDPESLGGALASDGTLWHRWWDGTRWVPWEHLALGR
ncbi:MAG: hypothetical protein ABIZ30_06005 [Candidatus Limnocylindrales bacterium]